MNRYLEKAAGIAKYWDNLTGSSMRKHLSEAASLSFAKANPEKTIDGSLAAAELARDAMFNTRIVTGAGVVGAGAASLTGLKAYANHRENKILNQLSQNYGQQKEARVTDYVGKAADVLHSAGHSVVDGVEYVGKSVLGTVGKATGAGLRDWRHDIGLKDLKSLNMKDPESIKKGLMWKGTSHHNLSGEPLSQFVDKGLASLDAAKKERSNARYLIGAGLGVTALAHSKGKREGLDSSAQYY